MHAVLERADPLSPDLTAELAARIDEQAGLWNVEVPTDELAPALVPMPRHPLSPLAPGLTLRQIGLRDRLQELDFEMPLGGGQDRRTRRQDIRLGDVGALVSELLPASDPLSAYGARLQAEPLRTPAVARLSVGFHRRGAAGAGRGRPQVSGGRLQNEPTGRLRRREHRGGLYGAPARRSHDAFPTTRCRRCCIRLVLHRFLRWRLPGYAPARHLGGVAYLFVRGMCGAATPLVEGNRAACSAGSPRSSW